MGDLVILIAISATTLYAGLYQGKNGEAGPGFCNGQRGYWNVAGGRHVFVVLNWGS